MQIFLEFFRNGIFWASASAFLVAQFIKFIIGSVMDRRLNFERLTGDGGMPSSHSATVTTLAFLTGWAEGYDSPVFAVAMILAVVVMHDAMGVRRETGKQAANIRQLFTAFNDMAGEKDKIIQQEKLKEFVGHSPIQVFFGILTGIAVSLFYLLLFGAERGI